MKIGFDISQTNANNKAGCGYYAHSLINSLLSLNTQNEFVLFPSFGDFYHDNSMPIQNPYPKSPHYGPHHHTLSEAQKFWISDDLESQLGQLNIVHANNFWCPIQLKKTRIIYTFYDFGFLINPDEWTTEINRQGCFNGALRAAMAADWIIAISEASRTHFLETFPHFPKNRIRVIYPSSRFEDSVLIPTKPAALTQVPNGKFWLSVGTIEPRKNLDLLVVAYQQYLKLGGEPMPLIFTGGSGWMTEEFKKNIQKLGTDIPIIMTGYVNDAELIWLYENCYANLYPSFFEGFGLPVLEAMQFGAPTICSNSSSLPEVAGTAPIQLSPLHSDDWANTMIALSGNPGKRQELQLAGYEQAKKFNAQKNARQVLDLYQEALDAPKRISS